MSLEETIDFLVEKEVGQQPPHQRQGKDLDSIDKQIDKQWEKLFSLQRDWGEPLSDDDDDLTAIDDQR